MNGIIKSVDSGASIPYEDQNILNQATDDAVHMDIEVDLLKYKNMSVPITSLASLGATVSSMVPALRTVTEATTVNMQGLYTLANASVGDTLKTAKNGNFWGAYKTADGASKFAQLKPTGPVDVSTVTTLPINPATMMMAVALHSIEQKLDKIEEVQQQIIDFLIYEKEAEIEADVQMLSGIISKYKLNWDNEHYVANSHKLVLDIQRTALKNMRIYQKQVFALLEKKQLFVAQNNVESMFADFWKKFKYYRIALYTYALASLLEIMLGGNFKEEYIDIAKEEIEKFAIDYRNLFERASIRLEKFGNGAIDTKVLKGIGTAGQAVGKFIGSVPGVRKGHVDEMLQENGASFAAKANFLEEKAVREFAVLGNPGTAILTAQMQDIIQIFNYTESICFDREYIYLAGKKPNE